MDLLKKCGNLLLYIPETDLYAIAKQGEEFIAFLEEMDFDKRKLGIIAFAIVNR